MITWKVDFHSKRKYSLIFQIFITTFIIFFFIMSETFPIYLFIWGQIFKCSALTSNSTWSYSWGCVWTSDPMAFASPELELELWGSMPASCYAEDLASEPRDLSMLDKHCAKTDTSQSLSIYFKSKLMLTSHSISSYNREM